MVMTIGHRGAKGYELENTLASFKKALKLGVDMIEVDTRLSGDGQVVVIHDKKVNRVTDGQGRVIKKNIKALKSLSTKNGDKILLLQEVLDLVNRKTKIDIELKDRGMAGFVYKIIKNYVENKNWSYEDFFISSFHQDELQKFNKLNSQIKLGLILSFPFGYKKFSKKLNISFFVVYYRFITLKMIALMHRNNKKIFAWPVNNYDDIERMKKIGVDGIISDFPNRIK